MKLALAEAQRAAEAEETPIGAVVVADGKVIAAAHNMREHDRDITAHAELIAVRQAAAKKAIGGLPTVRCTLRSNPALCAPGHSLPRAFLALCMAQRIPQQAQWARL